MLVPECAAEFFAWVQRCGVFSWTVREHRDSRGTRAVVRK